MKKSILTPATPANFPDDDARTLAGGHAIMSDPKRHKAAIGAAQNLHKEMHAKAVGMKMVAKANGIKDAHERKWFGPGGRIEHMGRR